MGIKVESVRPEHEHSATRHCPVCGSETQHLRTIDAEKARQALLAYFGSQLSLESCKDMEAYSILRCRKCTLEYAEPPYPGSSEFYEELGRQPGYYPNNRWEWGIALEELGKSSSGTLLEVGCGGGAFLKMAADALRCQATGIDINPDAVAACRDAGLQVYQEPIEAHARRFAAPAYGAAVAFHCLEHVENPLAFANSLFSLVRPGGFMLLSTPFSPMSFERSWHDPLNHPPHHLTRWNEESYRELARRLRAGLKLLSPAAASPLRRMAQAVALANCGTPRKAGWVQLLGMPILHPVEAARELLWQLERPRLNSRPASDVVLGIFEKH